MIDPRQFLQHPGRAGMFGALMDEYARAAADFCMVVEATSMDAWVEERESADPDCRSLHAIASHAVLAARGYASYIRGVRKMEPSDLRLNFVPPMTPADIRGALREAMHLTENSLEGWYDASDEEVVSHKFQVRWGPTYDPEMILEHAIVHLLRHRRQFERW